MLARYVLELSSDGHSPSTVASYAAEIGRWQRSGLDTVTYLGNRRWRPGTRTLRGLILQRYLSWAASRNLCSSNPLEGIHFRRPPAAPVRPFSAAEVAAMLALVRPVERAILLCLLRLGLRASELAGIREDDIDGETVTIRNGKGGKTRTLALNGELVAALGIVVAARVDYQGVYRAVRRAGEAAGVRGPHPHRCRHTFAHAFLAAGGDIGNLRLILGHTNFAQTAHYAAFYEQERSLAAHRQFLGASPPRVGSGP